MLDLCLINEAYAVCRVLVPSRDLCRIFAQRLRHTQCVGCLFLDMTFVKSLPLTTVRPADDCWHHTCGVAGGTQKGYFR